MLKFLSIVLAFSAFSANAQNDEAAIKQTIGRLFDGMRKTDTALLRSAFAPSGMLQSVAKNKQGQSLVFTEPLDSFIASIARPHKEVYDERITYDVIKVDGDLASVWTPYRFYLGNQFLHCGVDSYQLVRLNGEWKIQYLIDTRRREGCEGGK